MRTKKFLQRLLNSERAMPLIITVVVMGSLLGGISLWMWSMSNAAKHQAQALVGEHQIVETRHFLFAGKMELLTSTGKTIELPTNTSYGSALAKWGFGLEDHPTTYRVRIEYAGDDASNVVSGTATHGDMAGAYLRFTELQETDAPQATLRPTETNTQQ